MNGISKTGKVLNYTILVDSRNEHTGNIAGSQLSQKSSI